MRLLTIPDPWIVTRWFTRRWWNYLLRGCTGWRNFRCRIAGHPRGEVFFRAYGTEPDHHCVDCGEDLG